jgi:hypothetical protein
MNDKKSIKKEATVACFRILSYHLPRKTEENHEKCQNNKSPGQRFELRNSGTQSQNVTTTSWILAY